MAATSDPRPAMVEIAHLMYERRLTNAAGGNLSCRVGDYIYISPRYLGSKQRWKLREEMVLVFDKDYQIVEGDPAMISRSDEMSVVANAGCRIVACRVAGTISVRVGRRPAMAFSIRAVSATVPAIGPTVSSDQASGKTPRLLTRP